MARGMDIVFISILYVDCRCTSLCMHIYKNVYVRMWLYVYSMCLVDLGSLLRSRGRPAKTGGGTSFFSTFFSNRFLDGLFMFFTSMLG